MNMNEHSESIQVPDLLFINSY